MNNNLKVAEEYARMMAAMTKKCWVSDNLPQLSRQERKQILKIYKKHFKTVEYDPNTGVCHCWGVEPYDLNGGDFVEMNSHDLTTGSRGSEVKSSTKQGMNIVDDINVVTSS